MSINLLPWREQRRKRHRDHDRLCIAAAMLLLILAIIIWQWHQQALLQIQHHKLLVLQEKMQKLSMPYAAAVKTQAEYNQQKQFLQALQKQRNLNQRTLNLIDDFVTGMPVNAYLKQMVLKDNQLLFKGQVTSHRELIQFLRGLAQQQGIHASVVETAHMTDEQDSADFLISYEVVS